MHYYDSKLIQTEPTKAICECGEQWAKHNMVDGKTYEYIDNDCTGYKRRAPKASEEVITNAKGGKQSDIPYAFDGMPYEAVLAVANVFYEGERKYNRNNWKLLSIPEILNHSIAHSFKYLSGDTTENHLANNATRALMALQLYIEENHATDLPSEPA
jgi:hypothetical protein